MDEVDVEHTFRLLLIEIFIKLIEGGWSDNAQCRDIGKRWRDSDVSHSARFMLYSGCTISYLITLRNSSNSLILVDNLCADDIFTSITLLRSFGEIYLAYRAKELNSDTISLRFNLNLRLYESRTLFSGLCSITGSNRPENRIFNAVPSPCTCEWIIWVNKHGIWRLIIRIK